MYLTLSVGDLKPDFRKKKMDLEELRFEYFKEEAQAVIRLVSVRKFRLNGLEIHLQLKVPD